MAYLVFKKEIKCDCYKIRTDKNGNIKMENAPSLPFLKRQNAVPCMNTKANRILITVLVGSKLQSILVLSQITNTILMFKTASTSFFYHVIIPIKKQSQPLLQSLRKDHHLHLQVEKLWQKLCWCRTGQCEEGVLAGWHFPCPHPGAHGLLHTQLVVCSFELGCNSNKIAEKSKCASINGILTFIATHSSCGCGEAPLNTWASFLLLNKV